MGENPTFLIFLFVYLCVWVVFFLLFFFFSKNFAFACIQTCSDRFLSNLMIETTELYILISFGMTLTFIQGQSCIGNQKLWCPFSREFKS